MVNQLRNPSFRAGEKLHRKAVNTGINMLNPLKEALEKGLIVGVVLMDEQGDEHEYLLTEVTVNGA